MLFSSLHYEIVLFITLVIKVGNLPAATQEASFAIIEQIIGFTRQRVIDGDGGQNGNFSNQQ